MSINQKLVKLRFEKNMDKYSENALVQKEIASKLVNALCNIQTNFEDIMELGAGSAVLTEELVSKIKFKNYCANDLTSKSENYVKKIIQDCRFYEGNALKIKPDRKFDLIISNAMFQWINLEQASDKFKTLIKPQGILAFSTFTEGNFAQIKEITGLSLDYKTGDEITKIFSRDWELLYREEYSNIMTFNNPLELLLHLKYTGVNSLSDNMFTIKDIKGFCDKFNQLYNKTELTYLPLILIFKKR